MPISIMHGDEPKLSHPTFDQEARHPLLLEEDMLPVETHTRKRYNPLHLWLLHGIVELVLIILLYQQWQQARGGRFANEDTPWTPAVFSNEHPHLKLRFQGNIGIHSPYHGPPSPEVERAWHDLSKTGAISIPEGDFRKLNASANAVKVPKELGGGRLALLEFTHQIHCLHILWKHTYPDYYREEFEESKLAPEQFHEHMDHCADILRQKLMCDADTTVITYNWIKGHYMPHPNFNVEHRCRDIDAVLQYAHDKQVNVSDYGRNYFTRPKEYVEFAEPPYDPNEVGDGFP